MPYNLYKKIDKKLQFIFILSLLLCQSLMAASSGTIKGKVFDKDSKEPLTGANIVIKGTSLGAASDLDGNFSIHNVSSGSVSLEISYIGYNTITVDVNISDGQTLTKNFYLTPTEVQGKVVTVTAQAEGQIQAINQQLSSNSIVNIVSEKKIQELPDFNAAEAIGRLPGVSTLRSSGEGNKVVIRGISPQYNIVAVDGIDLGATGNNDRSVDLTMISPNMLQAIEVTKALTPDMEGNALGGFVNMKLREAPDSLHADLLWQQGYTKLDKKYNNFKAVASVSDRFFNNLFGIYALVNAEQVDRSADNFKASYYLKTTEPIPGVEYAPIYPSSMGLNRHTETRNRYGANLILDYKLPNGKITVINFFSRLRSDYSDYTTTRDVQNKILTFNYSAGIGTTDVVTNAVQGEYDFGIISMDMSISNSYSRNNTPDIRNYIFREEGAFPGYIPPANATPENVVASTVYDINKTYLYSLGYSSNDYKEDGQTYKANFKLPFNLGDLASGFLKAGGSFKYIDRENDQFALAPTTYYGADNILENFISRYYTDLQRDPNNQNRFYSSNFTDPNEGLVDNFLGNRFGNLMWIPKVSLLNNIVNTLKAYANTDAQLVSQALWYAGPFQNYINDYSYIERYYATYVMSEIDFGPDLMVVGGARYEDDNTQFSAYQMKQATQANNQPYTKVTAYRNNHYWLPSIQAKYDVASWMDIRLAYTMTLARPDFTSLSPYVNIQNSGDYLSAGNPDLKPARSTNYDLMVSLHNNQLGLFTIGGFYKTIRDLVYYTSYQLLLPGSSLPGYHTAGDFNGANTSAYLGTFLNNPNAAYLKGIETDIQHRFWYLPFPFNGIILNINYTHMWSNTMYPDPFTKTVYDPVTRHYSSYLVDSARAGRIVNQPNDILNASFGYDYEGFSGRLSFIFQGNTLSGITTRDELDGTTHDYFRIDASLRQKLPLPGLQVYLNLNNLNQRKDESAQRTVDNLTSQQSYGFTLDLGVRYTF